MHLTALRHLIESVTPLGAVVGATGSFCWAVYTWRADRREKLRVEKEETERLAEARRIEATRPFLEKQLALYAEAALTCARLVDAPEDPTALARFWELYWGELALVENEDVEAAMISFKWALKIVPDDEEGLRKGALNLARACRVSLARSWGVAAWVSPDQASKRSRPEMEETVLVLGRTK